LNAQGQPEFRHGLVAQGSLIWTFVRGNSFCAEPITRTKTILWHPAINPEGSWGQSTEGRSPRWLPRLWVSNCQFSR
jgi:hypothetical protein